MSGENKSTLSANESPSPPMSKRSRKRSSANFTLGDQSDDEKLSFSAWLGPSLKVLPSRI